MLNSTPARFACLAILAGLPAASADGPAPDPLRARVEALIAPLGPSATVSVAYRDLKTGASFAIGGDRPTHPASTMKIPVMMEVYRQAAGGRLSLDDRLKVRNEFASLVDGSPFRLDPKDDSELSLYKRVGEEATVRELVRLMITESSNLATNLLVDRVGAGSITAFARELGAEGVEVLRGVEDGKAFAKGINNVATAPGLAVLLESLAEGKAVSPAASAEMMDILRAQKFNDGIPAGLPPGAVVAHKTGAIKGVYHDVGVVEVPGRDPFVLVVLTRGSRTRRPRTSSSPRSPAPRTKSPPPDEPRIERFPMKAARFAALPLLIVALAGRPLIGGGLPAGDPKAEGFDPSKLARIQGVLDDLVAREKVAGMATLVARNGKVVHLAAAGRRDVEADRPLDRSTLFRIASMSKPITSAAVLILVDDGAINLDDPVAKFLPEFAAPRVLAAGPGQAVLVPAEGPITIRHLLTHTSGLCYRFAAPPGLVDAYIDLGISDGLAETPGTIGENVHRLARLPLAHQPGARFTYSLSTDVLGRVVEVASGRTFDEFLRDRLFRPLKMDDTGFLVPGPKRGRLAAVYMPRADGKFRRAPTRRSRWARWSSPPTSRCGRPAITTPEARG